MIVVKFMKPWAPYNAGETAGFTPEQLKERINVGSGPEQSERIPRGSYVGATEQAKAQLAQLFGEGDVAPAAPTPVTDASSPATPTPVADASAATPTPTTS
jgi:hypothetical protein